MFDFSDFYRLYYNLILTIKSKMSVPVSKTCDHPLTVASYVPSLSMHCRLLCITDNGNRSMCHRDHKALCFYVSIK